MSEQDFIIQNGVLEDYKGEEINVVIPRGVTQIGEGAFSGNEKIYTVVIPEGVTSIGAQAFLCCYSLILAEIPESVQTLGESAFEGCALTEIKLPSGLKRIEAALLGGCESLNEIEIPPTVTYIGPRAFGSCTELKRVVIPPSVTYLGDHAFYFCDSLREVYISPNVTAINEGTFRYCVCLKIVDLPPKLETIGDSAFDGCQYLKVINIPSGVTKIGSEAFRHCSSLEYVRIPASVTFIGSNAFAECTKLKKVSIENPNVELGNSVFSGCKNLRELDIPMGFRRPEVFAWGDLQYLDFKNIDCTGDYYSFFSDLKMPFEKARQVINWLEDDMPWYAPNDDIKEYVKHNLSEVLKEAVKSDDIMTLDKLLKLEAFPPSTKLLNSLIVHAKSTRTRIALMEYKNSVYTQDKVDKSESEDFDKALGVKDYSLSDLKTIFTVVEGYEGFVLFNYTGAETRLTIPTEIDGKPVIGIGYYTFKGCQTLCEIELPRKLRTIGEHAFSGCINLSYASIPKSIKKIHQQAFLGCEKLTEINYEGKTADWSNVNKSKIVPLHEKPWYYGSRIKAIKCEDGDITV